MYGYTAGLLFTYSTHIFPQLLRSGSYH